MTTTTNCRSCNAPDDDCAFLCRNCAAKLEQIIAELPAAIRQLQDAAVRQARVGNSPRSAAVPPETLQADAEQTRLPAPLRSREGRITLPTTALPFHEGAARLYAQAVNGVTTWARHIAESRGVDLALAFPRAEGPMHARCGHESCESLRVQRSADLQPMVVRACTWLVAHIQSVRLDEAAGEMHAKLRDLARRIARAIDRHDPDVFAGRCTARVISLVEDRDFDQAEPTMLPVLSECGTDLYANLDDVKVECPVCDATYDLAERRAELVASVADVWARPHTIANALTQLDEPVKPETLRKWIERDRRAVERWNAGEGPQPLGPLVLQVGIDDEHRALYRVGDVQARIKAMREKSQKESA